MKLHVAACTVIVYDRLTLKTITEPTSNVQIAIAYVILAILTACPFIFSLILHKNKKKLDDSKTRNKFGELYLGLRADKHEVAYYQFVFLVRRSIFIAITFTLFNRPGIQLQLMIALTILYIAYLGYSEIHSSKSGKTLELINESTFVVI